MKNLLAALLFSLTVTVSFAKDKAPVRDVAAISDSDECADDSTAGMIQCDSKNMKVVRGNMAKLLVKIRQGMRAMGDDKDELFSRLYHSHKAYKAYAVAECSLRGASMLGGSGERTIISGCYLEMMKKQITNLQETSQEYVVQN